MIKTETDRADAAKVAGDKWASEVEWLFLEIKGDGLPQPERQVRATMAVAAASMAAMLYGRARDLRAGS